MPKSILRDEVEKLLAQGAQLVDALPASNYHDLHLPGAINIPLKEMNAETTAQLRKDEPVIVYCHDYQ